MSLELDKKVDELTEQLTYCTEQSTSWAAHCS